MLRAATFRFIFTAIITHFRLSFANRLSFFLTIAVTVLKQILFLISWKFFFGKYKIVQGWNFDDMLVMYGIVCFAIGFLEAFFYGLKDLPRMVENGQLDSFILQPKNILLNVALSRGDMAAFGEILTGIILIFASGYLVSAFIPIVFILILSVLFVFSLTVYLNSIAFFMPNATDFIRELNLNVAIMASQPNAAYRGLFKMLTFTILPVALLSFLPIEYLRTHALKYLVFATIGNVVFFTIAITLFKRGLQRYESGNILIHRF